MGSGIHERHEPTHMFSTAFGRGGACHGQRGDHFNIYSAIFDPSQKLFDRPPLSVSAKGNPGCSGAQAKYYFIQYYCNSPAGILFSN